MQLLWAGLCLVLCLLLWIPAVRGVLPAPENVTVRCGDQRPLVSWDYSPQQPTNFTVRLSGSGRSFSEQTADQELDLSRFVWNSSEQMFEFHYVTITAEQGLNRSEPHRSQTFSYNRLKTVEVSCFLKFPPVILSGEGAEATLSLENPLYFYKELRAIRASAVFYLTAVIENQSDQDRRCGQKPVCKFSLDLPEDAEPCVILSGVISNGAEQILLQPIGPLCAAAPTISTEALLAVTIFAVFIVVILLVTIGICKTRAWVFPKVPTPKNLAPNPSSHRPSSTAQTETVYSLLHITGTRPRTIQDPFSPGPDPNSPGPDCHHVPAEDRLLIPPPDLCEDHDESAESTKTETLSLHSTDSELEVSNYERRAQVIEMDLSGDLVTGYTG